MFIYKTGDILESSAECLINTVNCEGYMGKGIAYQFKKRFPNNNRDYEAACRSHRLYIGAIHTYKEDGKLIINFPTKDKWRSKSKMEYIYIGLDRLVTFLQKNEVASIAIPPLGCGNGGLKWSEVKPKIIDKLKQFSDKMDIQIYEPGVFSKTCIVKEPVKPTLSHIILMDIKNGLRVKKKLQLQKTAFFFNIFYKNDFFKFDKHIYGPYAHSIEVISKQINESQVYYKMNTESYRNFCVNQLISKSVENKLDEIVQPLNKAIDFVNDFDDDKTLELVSTVCYIVKENPSTLDDILTNIQNWSDRKAKLFSENSVKMGLQNLLNEGIIAKNIIDQYFVV